MASENQEKKNDIDFHGAAIVDAKGNETEITEEMVQKAINELEPEIKTEEEPSRR